MPIFEEYCLKSSSSGELKRMRKGKPTSEQEIATGLQENSSKSDRIILLETFHEVVVTYSCHDCYPS